MPSFGHNSKFTLESADNDLVRLFNEVVKVYDCSVVCSFRGSDDQNRLRDEGKSTLSWPNSKHNSFPSQAVDVWPYPVDWEDRDEWYHFAGFVKGVASQMGISVRWGGDWDSDYDLHDQTFNDFPHWELV